MDSVYSDDNKIETKESECCDSQSDDYSPSKDVFKNIRTRYLSRVHSVTDPPVKDASLVDQAFFKANNASEPKNDMSDLHKDEFKLEIKNVTTDETNDDDSQRSSSGEYPSRVLAEAVLPPFEAKELKRQDAIDLCDETNDSPPVIPEFPENLIDLNSSFRLVKSDSSYLPKPKERTNISRNLSGTFNGKPKSYSMDNLNTNEEYKDALKEATSIEFLTVNTENEVPLFTEGSDSVFMSPIEKNNNKVDKIFEANNNEENNNIPVVKAEEILPFPYPDDIKKAPAYDLMQPLKSKIPRDISIDDKVEKQLKKVNEELKLTFKAAIERIIGENKVRRTSPVPKILKENDLQSNSEPNSIDYTDHTNATSKCSLTLPETEAKSEFKVVVINTKEKVTERATPNVNVPSPKDEVQNPLTETVTVDNPIPTEPKTEIPIDDNVSYHLKINTSDLGDDVPKIISAQSNPNNNINLNRVGNKLTTFLAPIKLSNGNIAQASPIIISPVLIQPVFFKPASPASPVVPRQDTKKATVYYSDIDLVTTENKNERRVTEEKHPEDTNKKKGLYQKNVKAKQLPFLSWKTFGSNDNLPENNSPSPSKNTAKPLEPPKTISTAPKSPVRTLEAPKTVGKLSKTPQWLIDNQYYQPMQNVPFVINTSQTFKHKPSDTIKEEVKITTRNTFVPPVPPRRYSEQENVYEEIGPVISEVITKDNNIADDEKISNKNQSVTEEFAAVTREELLKVPRRVKKPRNVDRFTKSKSLDFGENSRAVREMASITKSIISLSRAPSAKDLPKKPTGAIVEIVQNLEKRPGTPDLKKEVTPRKFSLQHPSSPSIDTNTGSLPREKPYWKTLDHKRLSHPLRSLKDPPPRRPLRKSALL